MKLLRNKEYVESQKANLFADRYMPKKMSELAVNKAKVKEFETFMTNPDKKILIIQGPPGCAKSTLIKTYCLENNLEYKLFKDSKMLRVDDTMGYKYDKNDKISDDFEIMINFINHNFRKAAKGKSPNDDK